MKTRWYHLYCDGDEPTGGGLPQIGAGDPPADETPDVETPADDITPEDAAPAETPAAHESARFDQFADDFVNYLSDAVKARTAPKEEIPAEPAPVQRRPYITDERVEQILRDTDADTPTVKAVQELLNEALDRVEVNAAATLTHVPGVFDRDITAFLAAQKLSDHADVSDVSEIFRRYQVNPAQWRGASKAEREKFLDEAVTMAMGQKVRRGDFVTKPKVPPIPPTKGNATPPPNTTGKPQAGFAGYKTTARYNDLVETLLGNGSAKDRADAETIIAKAYEKYGETL